MDIKFIINELLVIILMVLLIIFTRNFFNYYRCESKGFRWKSIKKLPKVTDSKEKIRLIVSLSNGIVMFDEYDPVKKCFSVPDVEAWRFPPPSYKDYMKVIKKMWKRGNK